MRDMKDTIIRIGVASLLASNLMLGLTGCNASAATSEGTQEATQVTATVEEASATTTAAATIE